LFRLNPHISLFFDVIEKYINTWVYIIIEMKQITKKEIQRFTKLLKGLGIKKIKNSNLYERKDRVVYY